MTDRFTRENRLNLPEQYKDVFESSLRIVDSNLLVIAKNNGSEKARLGLAISRKRIRSSVKRNLVKRLIRESFRKNQSMLSGWDVVVVSHRKLETINRKSIRNSLAKNWQKIQQCKKS